MYDKNSTIYSKMYTNFPTRLIYFDTNMLTILLHCNYMNIFSILICSPILLEIDGNEFEGLILSSFLTFSINDFNTKNNFQIIINDIPLFHRSCFGSLHPTTLVTLLVHNINTVNE